MIPCTYSVFREGLMMLSKETALDVQDVLSRYVTRYAYRSVKFAWHPLTRIIELVIQQYTTLSRLVPSSGWTYDRASFEFVAD